jgi:hypothetical protein
MDWVESKKVIVEEGLDELGLMTLLVGLESRLRNTPVWVIR